MYRNFFKGVGGLVIILCGLVAYLPLWLAFKAGGFFKGKNRANIRMI